MRICCPCKSPSSLCVCNLLFFLIRYSSLEVSYCFLSLHSLIEQTSIGYPLCARHLREARYKRSCQGTKEPSVFIQYSRMSRKVICQEQRKRGQETKGCLGDSQEGDNSGETQSDHDAHFLPLSLSISMRRKVIACSGGCEAVVDTGVSVIKGPRTLVNNIPKLISTTPRGSKVKGHAPGSLPVSTHNKDHHGQPLTFSL